MEGTYRDPQRESELERSFEAEGEVEEGVVMAQWAGGEVWPEGGEPGILPPLDEMGLQNAAKAAADARLKEEEEARVAARRAEMDAKYTPGGTRPEAHALGPGYDESIGGASGMGSRSVESLFDMEVKGGTKSKIQRQDPRVHTRVLSDADIKTMLDTGVPPKAVQASLKKRTEKGGLLGKAGLRNVESTGMPQGLVEFAMATKTAPAVLPVGWILYGFGTVSDYNIHNDPRDRLAPRTGPKPTVDMPDAAPVSGGLTMYRCSCCSKYLQAAEFPTECVYHPGSFTHDYGGQIARTRVWTCCKDQSEDHPGCRRRANHSEDEEFSRIARSLGQHIPADVLQAQAVELGRRFPGAYSNGYLAVEIRQKGADSISLQVLAPPQPSIAAVKTLLREKDSTCLPERTILSTSQDGEALDDRSALTIADGLVATGFACVDGCSRALVLYSRRTGEAARPNGQGSEQHAQDVQERKCWKKVPIRRGDSLQKLSLKYDLPVALIKSSNNIVGAEIEAWRDELWLPPSAAEGQKLKRPTTKLEEFFWYLKGEGAEQPSERIRGMQASLPSHEEAQVYLDMYNSVEEAVKAWEDDMGWEEEHQPPEAQTDAQLQVMQSMRACGIHAHGKVENPMNLLQDDDLDGDGV